MTKKLTLEALLAASEGKKILFLGREGLFTDREIERFLKKFKVFPTREYEEGLAALIEHHSLNPLEEDVSNRVYEAGIPLYKLVDFEKLLSEKINDDELLMGIKLSNDQERILRILGNEHISDALFVKLLKMYTFSEEEEDDRDDRDVIMYTLRRYIDIKPNEEDLLYSSLTLKRLAREATDPKLLEVLIQFPNITFLQKGKQKISLRESIATNPHIDEAVIARLLQLRDHGVNICLAANTSTPLKVLQEFAQRDDEKLNQSLASNPAIDEVLFTALLTKDDTVLELLLCYQPVTMQRYTQLTEAITNETLFAALGENRTLEHCVAEALTGQNNTAMLVALAGNESLDGALLADIYEKAVEETYPALARNPSAPPTVLEALYRANSDRDEILIGLAYNTATPVKILQVLYEKEVFEITRGIASNASVPLEILNILKIDTRLRNELTSNAAFVASITQKLGL
jgi:hypothetical protein